MHTITVEITVHDADKADAVLAKLQNDGRVAWVEQIA